MSDKPFLIELPDAERGRSQADLRLLDEINARLAKPPARRNGMTAEQARSADLKARDALERRTAEKVEAEALRQKLEEAARLAELRGEEVERDPGGKLNIRTRDSLLNLANAGKLSEGQLAAGRTLRAAYESRSVGLGSQMDAIRTIGTSPTYDNRKAVWAGIHRAQALQLVGWVERAILVGYFRNERGMVIDVDGWKELFETRKVQTHLALTMIRAVCGEGKALRDLGRSPTVFDRHATALATALDVADAVIRGR